MASPKHIVISKLDMNLHLTLREISDILRAAQKCDAARSKMTMPKLDHIVVPSDHPKYELIKAMLG